MVDLVHLEHNGLHHIVADKLKVGLANQVSNVLLAAGEEVVQADDLGARRNCGSALIVATAPLSKQDCYPYMVTTVDKVFTKVAANETGSACN